MKEDLNLLGNQYNFFTTYWTIGYIVGMIPSQIIISHIRPSIWIPAAEVVWAVLTFSFVAVKNEKHIYALRFLIGLFESPFYVGAMTLLGHWYTPTELGKRAGIFYSASFAANMFSGYLQAAVYKGLDGVHGLAGWRWLFIMCGVITVPGAIWGFLAVPDSPYTTKVWYLTKEDVELAKSRMIKLDRRPFKGIKAKTFKKILLNPWSLIFIVNCKSSRNQRFSIAHTSCIYLLLYRHNSSRIFCHLGQVSQALLGSSNQRDPNRGSCHRIRYYHCLGHNIRPHPQPYDHRPSHNTRQHYQFSDTRHSPFRWWNFLRLFHQRCNLRLRPNHDLLPQRIF